MPFYRHSRRQFSYCIIDKSPTHPTQNTLADNATTPLSSQANPLPTSCTSSQPTEAVGSGNIMPAQVSTILQFLSQALQSSASQQPPSTAIFSNHINGAPPIFSTAQQHSRPVTITTQSAPDPPSNSLQVLNDDALSTASSIPPNTGITQTDTSDPVLLQSLPPVPVPMQQRILRDEYIDFNTLLPEVMFSVATSTPFPNAGCSTVQPPRITSFSTWLDAWNIYIATVVAHNPPRASELLGYQRLIHSASKHSSTSAWLKYDAQFCTLAASNSQLCWDLYIRHSELWLDNVVIQISSSSATRTRWPCTYCGSTFHFSDRCPCCPFRSNQQDSSISTAQRGPGPNLPQ